MIINELGLAIFVTFASLVLLIIANRFIEQVNVKFIINFLFLSESVVLTFFFGKFPFFLSIFITVFSIYFIALHGLQGVGVSSYKASTVFSPFPKFITNFFPQIGIILIICVVLYEYFADWHFSSNNLLVICLSLIMIFYHKVPAEMKREGDFLLMFILIISVFFVLPLVIYKVISGTVGECPTPVPGGDCFEGTVSFFDETALVFHLLGQPLANLLSLLGYNVFASGQSIFFEDMDAGIVRSVGVARSCAGIASMQIFMAALISYLSTEYRRFDRNVVIILLTGLLVAYLANLLRMAIIIIVGHYWGIEALLLVHQYAGWVIFTLWVFLFLMVANTILGIPKRAET